MANATQHSVHPTGGSRRVFWQVAWLRAGSGKVAFPHPAHPRVTQTVETVEKVGRISQESRGFYSHRGPYGKIQTTQ